MTGREKNTTPWDPIEDALLGTATDSAVAARVQRSVEAVGNRRRSLSIPGYSRHGWTPEQDALLGTDTDGNIAVRVRKSAASCAQRRYLLKIPAYRRPLSAVGATGDRATQTVIDASPWAAKEISMLGVLADAQVAEKTGRSDLAVAATRRALGRPSVDEVVSAVLRCTDQGDVSDVLCMWYGRMQSVPSVDTLVLACGINRATAYRYIARVRAIAQIVAPDERTANAGDHDGGAEASADVEESI